MFTYNIRVAVRNLLRQKGISLINILGLAIGISCTIMLFLMVRFSYTTDNFQEHYQNIFLLQQKLSLESGEFTTDKVGGATGPAMAEAYPQIQSFTRIGNLGEMLLAWYPEGKDGASLPISFIEKNGAAVDSTFFDVFTFEFLYGRPTKGIHNDNFIYLTEKLSRKLFDDINPVGKTVYFQEGMELTVLGVLKELPQNSTIQFSYLVPFEVQKMFGIPIDGFGGTMFLTYFLMEDPKSAATINQDINDFLETKYEENLVVDRFLSHIRQVYLHGETKAFWGIAIFGFVGLGILLIAAINYINLSTAKSIDRAKEVGIRKTGGANRWQLIRQFLTESFLITLFSVNLAILIAEFTIPYFNNMFDAQLAIPYHEISFWLFIISLVVVIGIFAGFYPAFMLSSYQPSLILKNFQQSKSSGAALRKVLVVSQFTITLFFIVCTIFLFLQISYVETADLGLDRKNVIYIPTRGNLWNKFEEVKTELLKEASVTHVSSASELPSYVTHGEIDWGKEKEKQNTIARLLWCSEDLLQTMGIELASGRFYNKDIRSDIESGIVVNEEILKMLNYSGDPIGQRFRLWDQEKTIIGVVKDFTFFPIDIGGKAIVIPYRDVNAYLFIKTTDGFNATSLARLEKIIRKYNPDYPFEYYALADFKNPTVATSEKLIPILFYFSALGIFISCLGMFGLALFTVEKRTKEIGIRKVFGATIPGITVLLSRGFIKLVLFANLIALPLAYLTLRGILSFFIVKIELSASIFLGTGMALLVLAWLTVLWQSLKVARKNPTKSLRYE